MSSMLIAIDGPAGAGKGTLAYHLARIYNLSHLDTGLLYRGVALKMIEKKQFLVNEEAAIRAALSLKTEDLKNSSLRDEAVGNLASVIAALPQVREILLKFQRDFAENLVPGKQGVIIDGRDIGLVVFPHSLCKIYVTASPEVRAKRRLKELQQKGISSIYKDVFKDIQARDARDEKRKISPLRPATDAYILDTSELEIDDVIKKACLFVDLKYPEINKIV